MSITFSFSANDDIVLAGFRGYMERANNLTPAMAAIAGVLADATDRAFIQQRDPATGEAWAELSDFTAERIVDGAPRGKTPILQVTGILAQSFTPQWGPRFAAVATNDIRAGTLHFGAKAGSYGTTDSGVPIPFGDIPARGMLGFGSEDSDEIVNIMAAHIAS